MTEWLPLICLALLVPLWAVWMDLELRKWFKVRSQALKARKAEKHRAAQNRFKAGIQSLREDKLLEALTAFDSALHLLEDDPGLEVAVLCHRGFTLERLQRLEEALRAYADCQKVYGRMHDELQYLAAVRQGLVLANMGRWQEADAHLWKTIQALQRGGPTVVRLQLEAFKILVAVCQRAGHHSRVLEYGLEAARAAQRLGDAAAHARFLRALGDALAMLNRPDDALRSYEQSLDLFRRAGHEHGVSAVQRDVGRLYLQMGAWESARIWLHACLAEEERGGDRRGEGQLCYDMACLCMDQGDLQQAGVFLQRSMSLFRQTEDHEGIAEVGRTMMGLSVLMHRHITADQMTFRDIERGSSKVKKGLE